MAETGDKVAEQLNFQFGAGRKIAVAALRRKNLISISVPEKPGFAESGSGGDHRLVSHRHPFHAVESDLVLLSKTGDPPGIGFEVIDQHGRGKMKFAGQARGFHRPGKIRGFDLAIANGAGDSKAGDIGTNRLLGDELAHDLIEPAVVAAGKDALRDGSEMAIF